jgi:hypothetical protein
MLYYSMVEYIEQSPKKFARRPLAPLGMREEGQKAFSLIS